MDDKGLVEYYKRKLLERYAECAHRDTRIKISELLKTANTETMTEIIQLLEEGVHMPKNQNQASVSATDAPVSIEDKFAMLTEEEKEKVIAFAERLKAERYSR